MHINILDVKTKQLAHKDVPVHVFSCSNEQYGSSHILSKNRRHHQPRTYKSFKEEIWYFLLLKAITSTAEYLQGSVNMKTDHASCHFQDRSEWLLCRETFQKICQK